MVARGRITAHRSIRHIRQMAPSCQHALTSRTWFLGTTGVHPNGLAVFAGFNVDQLTQVHLMMAVQTF